MFALALSWLSGLGDAVAQPAQPDRPGRCRARPAGAAPAGRRRRAGGAGPELCVQRGPPPGQGRRAAAGLEWAVAAPIPRAIPETAARGPSAAPPRGLVRAGPANGPRAGARRPRCTAHRTGCRPGWPRWPPPPASRSCEIGLGRDRPRRPNLVVTGISAVPVLADPGPAGRRWPTSWSERSQRRRPEGGPHDHRRRDCPPRTRSGRVLEEAARIGVPTLLLAEIEAASWNLRVKCLRRHGPGLPRSAGRLGGPGRGDRALPPPDRSPGRTTRPDPLRQQRHDAALALVCGWAEVSRAAGRQPAERDGQQQLQALPGRTRSASSASRCRRRWSATTPTRCGGSTASTAD